MGRDELFTQGVFLSDRSTPFSRASCSRVMGMKEPVEHKISFQSCMTYISTSRCLKQGDAARCEIHQASPQLSLVAARESPRDPSSSRAPIPLRLESIKTHQFHISQKPLRQIHRRTIPTALFYSLNGYPRRHIETGGLSSQHLGPFHARRSLIARHRPRRKKSGIDMSVYCCWQMKPDVEVWVAIGVHCEGPYLQRERFLPPMTRRLRTSCLCQV
jgi:hypothetical protein